MKKTLLLAVCAIALIPTFGYCDDTESDEVMRRAKTLQGMNFKAGQLKLQAEMSESYKKMEDAGFIVGEDGSPIGVENITTLGEEVRRQSGKREDSPFSEDNPVVPREAIFGNQELPTLSGDMGNSKPQVKDSDKTDENADDAPSVLRLKEIRADSVVIVNREGPHELRNGQSIDGFKLVRFSIDKAFLTGPTGARILSIDWSKRVER